MRAAVIVFPGSNCDADTHYVLNEVVGMRADFVWHGETSLEGYELVLLPGGFSYGDYLRTGAMAAHSPVLSAVRQAAGRGVPVLGICNGFQILLEAGLLPGAMRRNSSLQFQCEWVHLRVESTTTPFTAAAREREVLRMPIAHADGSYFASPDTVRQLLDDDRVVWRYVDATGRRTPAANPNGSLDDIAGICNAARNVVGVMPHPERCSEEELGGRGGLVVWESLLAAVGE